MIASSAPPERDSLTSLLEAVPSYRGDLAVPERPAVAPEPPQEEPEQPAAAEVEEPAAPAASAGAGSAYADILMPRAVMRPP